MNKPNIFRYAFLNFFAEIGITALLSMGALFSLDLMGFCLALLVYDLFLIGISYKQFLLKEVNRKSQILILCLSHVVFVFPIFFLMSAAIGGMSMAVVEGVAGNVMQRYSQYAIMGRFLTLFSMIVIIPWSILCVYLMNRKTKAVSA